MNGAHIRFQAHCLSSLRMLLHVVAQLTWMIEPVARSVRGFLGSCSSDAPSLSKARWLSPSLQHSKRPADGAGQSLQDTMSSMTACSTRGSSASGRSTCSLADCHGLHITIAPLLTCVQVQQAGNLAWSHQTAVWPSMPRRRPTAPEKGYPQGGEYLGVVWAVLQGFHVGAES